MLIRSVDMHSFADTLLRSSSSTSPTTLASAPTRAIANAGPRRTLHLCVLTRTPVLTSELCRLRGFRIPRLNVGKVHPLARECTPSFLRSDSGEGLIGAHYPYFDDYRKRALSSRSQFGVAVAYPPSTATALLGRAFDPINERLLALQPQHDAEVARRQADDPKAEHYETELECFVRERKSEAKRRTDVSTTCDISHATESATDALRRPTQLGRAFLPPLDRWQAAREAERKAAREEEDRARRAAEEARRKAEKARLIAEANARKLKEARRWTSGDTDYRATCMPQACQLYSNAYGPLPRPAQREMLCQDAFLRLGAVDSFYEYVPHKRRLTSRSHWDDNKEALLEELASKELDLKLGVFNKIAAVEPSIAPIGATYSQHPGLDTGADDSVKPLPTRYLLNAIPEATHRLMDREVGKISHHFVCRRCKVHDAYPDILYHICDSAHPRRRLSLLDYQRYPRTTTRLCDVNQLELDPRRVQVVQALLKVAKIADSRKAEEAVDKTSGRWSCGACVADESSSVEGQEVPAALDFFPMVRRLLSRSFRLPQPLD